MAEERALPTIRRLPDRLVNRIAAGEVVERPASVVKELVENAIDAGSRRIDVSIADGGRSLISVSDDGCGMPPEALPMALERHATSKLQDEQLIDIRTLGFRGEALPSIASVSRMCMTSRPQGADCAYAMDVSGGRLSELRPISGNAGTSLRVEDLFFNLPARRKFLKTDRYEGSLAVEIVRRLAMAEPDIAFTATHDDRTLLRLDPRLEGREGRVFDIMGNEFRANAIAIESERDCIRLSGFIGLPTLSRNHARQQYLFVNGRPVQDRLLKSALRAGYSDLLFHNRQPLAVLFLDVDPDQVDVNVHPAKTEVRFREAERVRGLLVGTIKRSLAEHGHRTATTVSAAALGAMRPGGAPGAVGAPRGSAWSGARAMPARPPMGLAEMATVYAPETGASEGEASEGQALCPDAAFDSAAGTHASAFVHPRLDVGAPSTRQARPGRQNVAVDDCPLGVTRTVVHDSYIIAQNAHGLVIVDQHAAHERVVYERLKAQIRGGGVTRQGLLLPVVAELSEAAVEAILAHGEALRQLGLVVEPFGPGAIVAREIPAVLARADIHRLLNDLAEDLLQLNEPLALDAAIDRVLASVACHGSVRAGRRLDHEEADALLRSMESTPNSGQCNHGRPTYLTLGLSDIERLFGRRS